MIASTSLKAYRELKTLGRDQQTLYDKVLWFENAPYGLPSRRDLATALDWETSRVAARVNDLIRYGYLKEQGTKTDKNTGKTVKCLTTASPVDAHVVQIVKYRKVVKHVAIRWMDSDD